MDLAVSHVGQTREDSAGRAGGKRRTSKPRVAWHELKPGVFYRHEQAAQSHQGRGLLADKVIVSWQGQPGELRRRLNWEAMRGGLGRARQTLFPGDGTAWIWNLQRDRWATATGLLDFYHGSQHLWALGEACCGAQQPALTQWVEPRLHELRHGREQKVLAQIRKLKWGRGKAGEIIERKRSQPIRRRG